MAVYDQYPGIDENGNFPPEIANRLFKKRGSVFAGGEINSLYGEANEGIWQFSLTEGDTITGLPEGVRAGVVVVLPQLGGQLVSSYGDTSGPERLWYRGRNALSGSNPHGVWMEVSTTNTIKKSGNILPGDNLDFWYIPEKAGYWSVNSTDTAQQIINLPVPAPGKLINIPGGINTQIYISYAITGYPAGYFVRNRSGLPTSTWSDWVDLMSAGSGRGGDHALKHMYRNDEARKRLGYKIGGPAAVALQFDDYNAAFRDKVLPILREFDVPATMALAVNWVEGTVNHELAEAVPWLTVQDWVLNDGIEAQGHSWTHSDAQTTAAITKEIVESADHMESEMSSVVIDQWSMPGTGSESPYGGYHGRSISDFTETLAGKLLLSRYGFVGAARGGYFQPGGGVDYIGQSHGIGESNTVSEAKADIEAAIEGGYAVAMMHHPGWLDTAGYKTTAQLRELIQWLAQQRDAGRLIITTRRALNVFDSSTNYRDNLLPGAFNGNNRKWSGSGWGLNSSGNMQNSSTTTALSKSLTLLPIAWSRGGTREFHAIVKSTVATTLNMTVVSGGVLSISKSIIIPGNTWVDVRKFFTIPKIGGTTIDFGISKTGSGTLEIQQINCYAS